MWWLNSGPAPGAYRQNQLFAQDDDVGQAVDWLLIGGRFGFAELSMSAERFLKIKSGGSLRSFPGAGEIQPDSLLRIIDARHPYLDALRMLKSSAQDLMSAKSYSSSSPKKYERFDQLERDLKALSSLE